MEQHNFVIIGRDTAILLNGIFAECAALSEGKPPESIIEIATESVERDAMAIAGGNLGLFETTRIDLNALTAGAIVEG